MTLRLVALISVVLLLSLAAFGLLMGYYQNQMVQVVADTASDIGRAMLRALDMGEHEILLEGRSRNVFSWSSGQGPVPAAAFEFEGQTEFVGPLEEGVLVTQMGDSDEVQQRVRRIERIVTSSDLPAERIRVQRALSHECATAAAVGHGDKGAGCPSA